MLVEGSWLRECQREHSPRFTLGHRREERPRLAARRAAGIEAELAVTGGLPYRDASGARHPAHLVHEDRRDVGVLDNASGARGHLGEPSAIRIRDVPAARALLARIAEERPAAAAGEGDASHVESSLMIAPRGTGASSRGSGVWQRPAR